MIKIKVKHEPTFLNTPAIKEAPVPFIIKRAY